MPASQGPELYRDQAERSGAYRGRPTCKRHQELLNRQASDVSDQHDVTLLAADVLPPRTGPPPPRSTWGLPTRSLPLLRRHDRGCVHCEMSVFLTPSERRRYQQSNEDRHNRHEEECRFRALLDDQCVEGPP